MDGLQFVAALAASLAWPLAIVACVVTLRRQIAAVLPRLESVEFPGGSARFAKLPEIADSVADAASQAGPAAMETPDSRSADAGWSRIVDTVDGSPREAILAAWNQLEYQLNVVSDRIDPAAQHGWPQVSRTLRVLSGWAGLSPAVAELWSLKNSTARAGRAPLAEDALRYVSVAREVAVTLNALPVPGATS